MEQQAAFQKAPGLDDLASRMKLGLRLSRQRLSSNEPLPPLHSTISAPARPGGLKYLLLFPWFFLKRRIDAMIQERVTPLERQLILHQEKILDLEVRLEFLESNPPPQSSETADRHQSWKHLSS